MEAQVSQRLKALPRSLGGRLVASVLFTLEKVMGMHQKLHMRKADLPRGRDSNVEDRGHGCDLRG